MTDLTLLHESSVDESEIDLNGHLNFRFYITRAEAANRELMLRLGIKSEAGQQLRRVDTYNRFHREQFLGAKLRTFGGLLTAKDHEGVTTYLEIRNTENDDLAASFVVTSNCVELTSQKLVGINLLDGDSMDQFAIDIPCHGRPRSLSLDPISHPEFEQVSTRIQSECLLGAMNGRREGVVLEEDCDERGVLKEGVDPLLFVENRTEPVQALREMGPPDDRDEQGRRYGWAMLEVRTIAVKQPRLGDTVLLFSADVGYGEKWRRNRRWAFSKHSQELLAISDRAIVCLDQGARRAIAIPPEVKSVIAEQALPELM